MMDTPFPPFDPDGNQNENEVSDGGQPTRLRDIPLRTIFPNLLTLLAICSGLTAIRFAIEGRLELAIAAIILAAFLDGIDGRVARFLKSTTRFGAQMDSLADFVNFGVAPAMILYFSLLNDLRSVGWIVGLIYAICACLRLARFNVMLDMADPPEWQRDFFVGVPAPAAAMIVLLPIYLLLLFEPADHDWLAGPSAVYALVVGLLMVSTLPSYSGKNISQSVRRDLVLPIMIIAIALIGMLLTYPWTTLSVIAIAYILSLPFSFKSWRSKAAAN